MHESLMSIIFFVGIIFCILGLISKIFPPKKINWLYGYRTSLSMRNIDTWNVANKYSTKLMLMEGIVLTIVGVVTLFIPDMGVASAILAIGLVLLSTIILIAATEKHLIKVFDKDGNRKQNI